MSSNEPGTGWLEVHGQAQGTDMGGLTVTCPYRGPCALSACLRCSDFTTLETDASGQPTYAGCRKAEADPRDPFVILERRVRDAEGVVWTVVACGRHRRDGTWDGWLQWSVPADGASRCGGCETNESSREALTAWAEGLSTWSCRGFLLAREALPLR